MGNVCSCLSDVDADTLGYSTKEVSKYAGTEQYRPQVVSDAQRSSHSSSPERRRAGRDAPGGAAEQQDAQLQQADAEQAWRSPGSAAEQAEQEAAPEPPEPPSGVPFSWTKGELIGIGAFGRVFSALNNNTGELVAVKQVSFAKDEALQGRVAEHIRALEAEVQVLQTLQHENIVRYLGTQITDDSLHIFLEYVPGGSIASLLAKFGPFPESVIRLYTAQLLRGLEYLHQKGIMHRDIKGANILIDPYGTVKLADFGASKVIEDLATVGSGSKSIRGTPYWMAPEVIKQTGHGRPADIWSLGCTVIEMALGKPPWSEYSTPVAAMFQIASSRDPPKLPEHLSPEAQDFLKICFNRVARDRANATRLLKHPFVANVQLQQPLPFPGQSPASSSQQAGSSSSSSRPQGPARSGSASAQQQQQYAARQSGGPSGSRSSSSLRPLNAAGGQPAHGAAAKASEQARHSPGQARNSPRRQAGEGAGSPAAAAGAASHLAQRGDDPARSPSQQQQQQHSQQQHKQQQEQLQSKQQQQQQQQHASPRPHQQQAQPHGQAGSVCSSQEELGLGLQQTADGCMTLVEWNPMQEPSWAPPYQPAPAPASSNRRQPAGDGSTADKQQQQQLCQHVAAPVEQPEVADAPRPPTSASRAAGIMAAGAAHVTSSTSSTSSSSSGSSSSITAPGQLRHGSLPGPIGSSKLGGKRQGIGSCSVAGPLSKGPAARASSVFGLAAAAAIGTSPASSSAAAAAAAAGGGGLLGSLAAKSGKQVQQPASNLLASVCSPPAAPPALATSSSSAAAAAAAARPAAAADGSQQAGSSAQDQWGGGPGPGLRLADVDVAKSTKLAQWENELYEELERHRKEQRASRAAGRSLTAAVVAAPQRQ